MLVKNIRLTRFVPIVHDLAMHFEVMNIDWIERESNGVADLVAKSASQQLVMLDQEKKKQPDGFKVEFKV